ncbi:MAG TPA: FtsL-like putative cell division protein [Chitinophagales bacterium]|nr:FtsL-like putative cell division protein [Chitinophagales bacterium]
MPEEEINIEPIKTQNRFQKMVESVLRVFGIDDFISYAQVMHNFLFVVAIVFIGVIEIFNTHLAVRLNRGINKKQETIKELRWEYMTVKTEMNQKSKQSELQKALEPTGLKSLQEPPKKIEVKKGTLE